MEVFGKLLHFLINCVLIKIKEGGVGPEPGVRVEGEKPSFRAPNTLSADGDHQRSRLPAPLPSCWRGGVIIPGCGSNS